MSEIKFIKVLDKDISAIKPPAEALKEVHKVISSADVCRLDTAIRYIEQNIKIGAVIDLYAQLVVKDVVELLSVLDIMEEVDEMLARK